ncbi:acyltransferase family protein [Dyella choica]|uniref:Acyltransferase n=1 Tax=Dyella choica TaxID=1927959 RepID=A0A3S0PNA0_9GAMM|nr:acyltransferase [Dyella choica]RUL74954.1 acyltransferase [Dyella choica]
MQRLRGLDLLRAVAIVWVMLFHSWTVGGLSESFRFLQDTGWMGVDLFFVLSGYLIGGQLLRPLSEGKPLQIGEFYLRRCFRILPAYLVVLGLYFLLPGFNREGGLSPLWQYLSYTVNLFVDYAAHPGFSHVWSLCVEEHFYLLFPLMAWFLVRRGSPGLVITLALGVLASGMLLRGLLWYHSQDRYLEVIYYPTYNRLDGLLAGVLLAAVELYRPLFWSACLRRANTLLLPLGIALLLSAILIFRDKTSHFAVVAGYPVLALAMALLVWAGTHPSGLLAKLCVPGVRWLAITSYSLYLIHKAAFKWVEHGLPVWTQGHDYLRFAAYTVVALAAGAALHHAVERPFLVLRDRAMVAHPKTAGSNELVSGG